MSIRPLTQTHHCESHARVRRQYWHAPEGRPVEVLVGVPTMIAAIQAGSIAVTRAISKIANRRRSSRWPNASMTNVASWSTRIIPTRDAEERPTATRRQTGGTTYSLILAGYGSTA